MLLYVFDQLSELNINFHKSELFFFGEVVNASDRYFEMFGCAMGQLPIQYLGTPIHFRKLRNVEWKEVEGRLEKRLSSWKGKHLSTGGHLIPINYVLSNFVMYMMSFFKFLVEFSKG
jgi:hypothetical protein